jgi:hypothetical protein
VVGDVIALQEYLQTTTIIETEGQGPNDTVSIVSIKDSTGPSGRCPITVSTSIPSKNIDVNLTPITAQTLAATTPLSPGPNQQRADFTSDPIKSKTIVEQHEYTSTAILNSALPAQPPVSKYTDYWRRAPPKSYAQSLSIFPGRLSNTPYHLILLRPFILFAYPSILYSSLIYACSVGWLIVLSESISSLYRNRSTYNFTAFQTGLVYLSAFVGGVLGTAVAGKCSDFVVKYMAKRNNGIYEPEFRLVSLPTTIGTPTPTSIPHRAYPNPPSS